MSAVFRTSQAKGSARLVLLAMADEASDEGLLTAYRRSQSWLAQKANVDGGTCRRAIKQLVALGEVVVIDRGDGRKSSDYQLNLPGIEGVQDAPPAPAGRAPRGGKSRAQGVQDAPPIIPFSPGTTQSHPKGPAPKDAARSLVQRVWERSDPKPATPFIAAVKIAERLLAAGHSRDAIGHAMLDAPTISTGAVELQLNRGRNGSRRSSLLDEDRGGPVGRVQL